MANALDLNVIRDALIRQEDTIIFALIERAQFALNNGVYDPSKPAYSHLSRGGSGPRDSFLDFMLVETERLHARVRRYTSPDEHAFFPQRLPPPELPPLSFDPVLHPCLVNLNERIKNLYVEKLLPAMCRPGDDAQHGSTVVADVHSLQAISKRVHYGMFVAESKFRSKPEQYTALIHAGDEEGIMALLTNAAVEERVLRRVRKKASTFGREIDLSDEAEDASPLRLDPEVIVDLYRDYVIPLTKVAEVQYLQQRLDSAVIAYHGPAGGLAERTLALHFVHAHQGPGAPQLLRLNEASEVVSAVMNHKAHHGVVTIEQGDSGVQNAPINLLRDAPLQVTGEINGSARFRLLSPVALTAVTRLRARREVLRICQSWLRRSLPHVVDVEELSDLADDETPWAATLGSPEHQRTAYLADCDVQIDPALGVIVDVGDESRDRVRCVILSQMLDSAPPAGNEKTLALFGLGDGAGSLARSLDVFSRRRVNLTKLQSHEDLQADGKYILYCELQGHHRSGAISEGVLGATWPPLATWRRCCPRAGGGRGAAGGFADCLIRSASPRSTGGDPQFRYVCQGAWQLLTWQTSRADRADCADCALESIGRGADATRLDEIGRDCTRGECCC